MKIALGFSLKLKLFDFTSLRQGQFLENDSWAIKKNQKQKHTRFDFMGLC